MKKRIVTIGRQFGSGGREIGQRLAQSLGIQCYDSRIIKMAAEDNSIDINRLAAAEEKKANSFLYSVQWDLGNAEIGYNLPVNDVLFHLESEVIRKVARMEPCVIIGRCADFVLEDREDMVSAYIWAPLANRSQRIQERHEVDDREARNQIKKVDRQRAKYYSAYTGKRWDDVKNYDVVINSASIGIPKTVELLKSLVETE